MSNELVFLSVEPIDEMVASFRRLGLPVSEQRDGAGAVSAVTGGPISRLVGTARERTAKHPLTITSPLTPEEAHRRLAGTLVAASAFGSRWRPDQPPRGYVSGWAVHITSQATRQRQVQTRFDGSIVVGDAPGCALTGKFGPSGIWPLFVIGFPLIGLSVLIGSTIGLIVQASQHHRLTAGIALVWSIGWLGMSVTLPESMLSRERRAWDGAVAQLRVLLNSPDT